MSHAGMRMARDVDDATAVERDVVGHRYYSVLPGGDVPTTAR
jgi:hypothetical protein